MLYSTNQKFDRTGDKLNIKNKIYLKFDIWNKYLRMKSVSIIIPTIMKSKHIPLVKKRLH